jgi:hypothetical protein
MSGRKGKGNGRTVLLHGEPDMTVRVIRDVFNEDFTQLVVSGDAAWAEVSDYVASVARPRAALDSSGRARPTSSASYRIHEQIAKAMDRKVWLPSGGSLVIDRTEAMTVVDVNTGKFVGFGRQPRRDGHPQQHRGRRRDRPPAAAARHRRDHRHRLHRHGPGVQPRPGRPAAARVPRARPDQAPGRRGHLTRAGPDDPQAGRVGAHRGLLRQPANTATAGVTSSTPSRWSGPGHRSPSPSRPRRSGAAHLGRGPAAVGPVCRPSSPSPRSPPCRPRLRAVRRPPRSRPLLTLLRSRARSAPEQKTLMRALRPLTVWSTGTYP